MELYAQIEALLFWKGEPMTFSDIGVALRAEPDNVAAAAVKLRASLAGRGVTLVEHDGKVMLGTAPEMSELFETMRKEELSKELSKASLETLSIVLYRNGVSRTEINFIRGVNSGFILRALEVRGLIEKESDPRDTRTYIYKPTLELLSFMGVGSVSELPRYEEIRGTLMAKLEKGNQAEDGTL